MELARPAAVPARRPLTAAQARLWELESREDGSGVHHFAIAYSLNGPLDAGKLEAAIRAVAARHVALRARVGMVDGEPWLEDQPELVIELERPVSFMADSAEPAGGLETLIPTHARRPIDLAVGPAWRGTLFSQGDDRWTLLLQFHHLITDRWSVSIFIGDLARAYRALTEKKAPFEGEPPPDPVAQLALVGGLVLEEAEIADQIIRWKQLLAHEPATLLLPSTGSRDVHFAYDGERLEVEIDEATRAAAKAAGLAHSTTLFPVLLTAFAATLFETTGQTDLLICMPVIGRHRVITRGVIGYFNNILPVRLDLSGNPSLEELLGRVTSASRDAMANPEIPFQTLAALPELAGVRLTRCLFAVQNIPGLALQLPGIETSYRDTPNGTANFDISLFFEEKGTRLHLMIDYKTAVLTQPTVAALQQSLAGSIRRLAEQPESRLGDGPQAGMTTTSVPRGHSVTSRAEPQRPESALEERLTDLWQRAFPGASIGLDTDFFDLGGDSMRAARLFERIRTAFGYELPLATLFEAPTIRKMVERLKREDWVAPWMSVVPVQSEGHRTPFFCVHGGGGNVIAYRKLAEALGPDQPLYCLQAKGLRAGDRPLSSVEEMAEHYLEAMRRSRPHGPYLLGGHSLGAVVAFEMAQHLLREGESVPFLALLDHPGPDLHLNRTDWFRYHLMNLSMLNMAGRLEYIRNHLRWKLRSSQAKRHMHSVAPKEGEAGTRTAAGPITLLEASLLAIQNYRILPYPGRLTLFRARQGSPKILSDPHGGWAGVAPGRVTVVEVPGTHMTMMKAPHVQSLGSAIAQCLERV